LAKNISEIVKIIPYFILKQFITMLNHRQAFFDNVTAVLLVRRLFEKKP